MMKTKDFVEACRVKLGSVDAPASYYKVAKALNLSTSALGNYKNGRSAFADDVVFRVANLLECEPVLVALCVQAERSDSATYREEIAKFLDGFRPPLSEGKLALSPPKGAGHRCILW